MMKQVARFLMLVLFVIATQSANAQQAREYVTINPAASFIHGRGWSTDLKDDFDRLPAKAESMVRKDVWNLSKHSAGLSLRFMSNSNEVIIRYTVSGNKEMYHMPSTGVSGLDLYARSGSGPWIWAGARASFGDTIVYRYTELNQDPNREYTLYFPLYNHVNWMEISYPKGKELTLLAPQKNKPIVIYGTSIAQGGCASRPGLGWTNILGRKLDMPMVNLAFSGNGRLEKEVLELIAEIDAEMYVLDCLPNLTGSEYLQGELKSRLVHAITYLQSRRPGVPILLNEHAGYTNEYTNDARRNVYQAANRILVEVADSLKSAGTKNIFLQTKKDVGQDIESTVDGTHPNDIGMMQIAEAYDKRIRVILGLAK
jgi:hypothetical protein